jgi:hypothetical protein
MLSASFTIINLFPAENILVERFPNTLEDDMFMVAFTPLLV